MSFLNPSKTEERRRRFLIGGGAVLMTAIIMLGFAVENRWGYLPPDPVIIYAQSWPADRSLAEVKADTAATEAARQAKLAEARAYIATLTGEARAKAQKQYDDYVAGHGERQAIPYVAAAGTRTSAVAR